MAISVLCFICVIGLLALLSKEMTKVELLASLSNARQVQIGVKSMALDYGNAKPPEGVWPADCGIKTGHEYVQYLVKEGLFKIGELYIFTTPNVSPATSLDTISPEHIGFRFGNVSEKDPPNTIFIVTPNFISKTPYPFPHVVSRWDFLNPLTAYREGFLVVTKDGTKLFLSTKHPNKVPISDIGVLPPREPKFLDP